MRVSNSWLLALGALIATCSPAALTAEPTPSFDQSDAGIYGLIHVDGHLTGVRFRLTKGPDRWRLEQTRDDGTWEDVTCEAKCQLQTSSPDEVAIFTASTLPAGWSARCLHNHAFAICRMEGADLAREYAYVALIVHPPKAFKLKYMGAN
jgi:hypothetical protein